MKTDSVKTVPVAIVVLVISACAIGQMHAQSVPTQRIPVFSNPYAQPAVATEPFDSNPYAQTVDQNDPRAKLLQRLNDLLKKLKASKEGENREKITKQVETALTEYFDLDMEFRQGELDRLTKRTDETEARLKKRENARDDLIDLQLKSYEQDAKGLGLFGEQLRNDTLKRWPVAPATARYSNSSSGGARRPAGTEDSLQNAMNQIRETRGKLQKSKTDEDRAAALKELETALCTYFDRDMELRRKQLEDVREELKDLESKLKKRMDAKAEIVALQLKMFINEANGLGFFNGGVGRDRAISPFLPSPMNRPVYPQPAYPQSAIPGPGKLQSR